MLKVCNSTSIRYYIILILSFCGFLHTASAESLCDSTIVQQFKISYPVSETELHADYHDNATNLRIIKEYFLKSPKIDSIIIYSFSSPEGSYKTNKRLAEERGKRARNYLLQMLPEGSSFPDSLIIIKPTAENWDGLYENVARDYPYEDKEDVLNLLSRKDISNDRKKQLLKSLNRGIPWEYIKTNILPHLRYAVWVAEWVYVPYVVENIPHITPVTAPAKSIAALPPLAPKTEFVQEEEVVEESRKRILALKTNLLYDALTFANFSIEVPLYKDKLSILYYHQFPWWRWGQTKNEYCIRFLSIGAEARWWFKTKDRFNGHFLGIYGESGKYDFEIQRSICYQGEHYSTGLTYGYAMPVGKRLNLEFSISAGYASVAYRGYTPSKDYEILFRDPSKVGRLHYFGPTKAQISLVVPITAKTKGGNDR